MKVPFNNLKDSYERDEEEINAAVHRVLQSGHYIGGTEVDGFEHAFAAASGAVHAVGVANGTDAIALGLRAAGVGRGDEVVVPALSAYPTLVGVTQAEAVPVFADIGQDGLIDPARVAEAITQRTRAIVPVHLYGTPCNMDALHTLARERGLWIVEDCAQAHGASWRGAPVGQGSTAAAWSFYPTKNLGALGDAGAVTTADTAVADRLRMLRNYGQRNRYEHVEPGVNSRLDPLQAAILQVKLRRLPADNQRRRALAERYETGLRGVGAIDLVPIRGEALPSRHLMPILLRDPDRRPALQDALHGEGIETLIHYPIAMPDQQATQAAWRGLDRFPVARRFCRSVLSLPLYPTLTEEQVDCVVAAVRRLAA